MSADNGIEIINPIAAVSDEDESPSGGKKIETLEGIRIGLLDNNMPHAGDFLGHVGESFSKKYGAKLLARKKGWTARSAGRELLDEIASNCDVAVTGFGV